MTAISFCTLLHFCFLLFWFFGTRHLSATCTHMLLTSDHLHFEICFPFYMIRHQNLSLVLSSHCVHPLSQADVIIKSHLFLRVGLGRTCVRLFFLLAPNVKKKQASSSEDWLGNRHPWSIHSQSADFSTRGLRGEKNSNRLSQREQTDPTMLSENGNRPPTAEAHVDLLRNTRCCGFL